MGAAGRVYSIEAGRRGPIKIGTVIDVAARLHDLQGANPKRMSLIATLPGDHEYEHELQLGGAEPSRRPLAGSFVSRRGW